ncbi:MAG: hypothetical protein ACI4UA_02765 [Bacteroidaceae bacterium]
MKRRLLRCCVPMMGALALVLVGCSKVKSEAGSLTDALDDSAWSASQWISAKNAPVLTISPRVMVNRPRNLSTIPVVENSSRRDVLSVL